MSLDKNQILIISIVAILIISVIIYLIIANKNKSKENYICPCHRIENFIPTDKKRMREIKADRKIDDYLNGISNAHSAAASGVLTAFFQGMNKSWDSDSVSNMVEKVGLALLQVGFAYAGLGFIGEGLAGLFGGKSANEPINYDRIAKIVDDALDKNTLKDIVNTYQNITDSLQKYLPIYNTEKAKNYVSCLDINNTEEQNINCILHPSPFDKEIKFDYHMTGSININDQKVPVRKYLNDFLSINSGSNVFANLVNNSGNYNKYGIPSIINIGQKSAKAGVLLYPIFKLYIGFYITYYQEMALIDQNTTPDGKYINPYMSRSIGFIENSGKQQPSGTLLGSIQELAQNLFDYIKILYKNYYQKLVGKNEENRCCKGGGARSILPDCWKHGCQKWYTVTDTSDTIPDEWFELNNYSKKIRSNYYNEKDHGDEITKREFMSKFENFMNYPISQLQELKKMAGIKYLKGEKNYEYWIWITKGKIENTNTEIIYDQENGGFPFGNNKLSYIQAIQLYRKNDKDDKDAKDVKNNRDYLKNAYLSGIYSSPYFKTNYYNQGMLNSCNDLSMLDNSKVGFDASFLNSKYDQNTYTKNMICENPESDLFLSSMLGGLSPGKLNEASPNSRVAFCLDSKTGRISKLIPSKEVIQKVTCPPYINDIQFDFTNFVDFVKNFKLYINGSTNWKKLPKNFNGSTNNNVLKIGSLPASGFLCSIQITGNLTKSNTDLTSFNVKVGNLILPTKFIVKDKHDNISYVYIYKTQSGLINKDEDITIESTLKSFKLTNINIRLAIKENSLIKPTILIIGPYTKNFKTDNNYKYQDTPAKITGELDNFSISNSKFINRADSNMLNYDIRLLSSDKKVYYNATFQVFPSHLKLLNVNGSGVPENMNVICSKLTNMKKGPEYKF